MTHSELVTRAKKWLTTSKACSVVFAELCAYSLSGEIPDVIGWKAGNSYLIECKASRADFLSDKKKVFRRNSEIAMGDFRYYACVPGIIKEQDLPNK